MPASASARCSGSTGTARHGRCGAPARPCAAGRAAPARGRRGQIASKRARDAPADDRTREDVDDEGHVHEAGPARHVGQVRDPELVRAARAELTLDQIRRIRRGPVGHRRDLEGAAANRAAQAQRTHQPFDGAAGHSDALAAEAAARPSAAPYTPKFSSQTRRISGMQLLVALGTHRAPVRISPAGAVLVVGRRGDRQHGADRLDPELLAVAPR